MVFDVINDIVISRVFSPFFAYFSFLNTYLFNLRVLITTASFLKIEHKFLSLYFVSSAPSKKKEKKKKKERNYNKKAAVRINKNYEWKIKREKFFIRKSE